jgi:hypothetical protein
MYRLVINLQQSKKLHAESTRVRKMLSCSAQPEQENRQLLHGW